MSDVTQAEFDGLVRRIEREKSLEGLGVDALAVASGASDFAHVFTERGRGLHEVRSLSKIVVSLCTGLAIHSRQLVVDGALLCLDTRVWPTFRRKVGVGPGMNVRYLKEITVRHLLTQTTGFCNEELMLNSWVSRNSDNLLELVLSEPIEAEPGARFVYSNVSAFLLSVFLQEVSGESMYAFAQKALFAPLGITEHKWLNYGAYSAGGTGLFLTIEDVHKLGRLMLQRGVWKGRHVVPESFVRAMTSTHVDVAGDGRWREHSLSPTGYGFLLWTNCDGFYCSGAGGQYVIVEPFKRLAVSVLSSEESSVRLLACLKGVL